MYFLIIKIQKIIITEKNNEQNKNKFLLNNINLEIKIPSSISVTGNSGCGKTTFVDLLTGLLSPLKDIYIYQNKLKK